MPSVVRVREGKRRVRELCCDLRVARMVWTRSAGSDDDDPEGDEWEEWEM